MDVLLSSGFLAFARHLGFRRALLEKQIPITGICGTSSGSVVGALWANGLSEAEMVDLLHEPRPITQLNFNWQIWNGFFHFANFQKRLQDFLPQNIEDLPIPFAVGVCSIDQNKNRKAELITNGPLVPAIAASCAIPYIFRPVSLNGIAYRDGGFADRIAAKGWRNYRPNQEYIAHIVDRSNGVDNEQGLDQIPIIRTPRSFASLFSMGDFPSQMEEAYQLSQHQMRALQTPHFGAT